MTWGLEDSVARRLEVLGHRAIFRMMDLNISDSTDMATEAGIGDDLKHPCTLVML